MASNQQGESPLAKNPIQDRLIGWADDEGNLFKVTEWKPAGRFQKALRPVYDFSPSEISLSDQQRGAIAYQLTRRLVIDMPTARAAVDAALKQ